MKFPAGWIGEFVRIDLPTPELADRLSAAGLVVDAVEGDGDDAVLDIDVPANRPDCMNVYGIAREIAAFTGHELRPYPAGAPEAAGEPPASESVSIEIADPDLCARYAGRVIRGVHVGTTPEWMAGRLRAAGLNVVNSIVDITNYVLWEYGHPLHAFDLTKVGGGRIVVRRARSGEKLATLDGVVRALDQEMLVIADATKPSALGGVMGGEESMIGAETREVLLEAAWFDPVSIRRTSKRLALPTDASYRFERRADVEAIGPAIDRAATLISEIAGGRVAPGILDTRAAEPAPRRSIHIRLPRAAMLIGAPVDRRRASDGLKRLGFDVQASGDGLDVTVPHHRRDIFEEVDLIEEVARAIGYESIPETIPLLSGIGEIRRSAHQREECFRQSLLASGFDEILSMVYVSEEEERLLREPGAVPVPLTNPMAEDQSVLRSSLLPGLTQAVRHNLNHGVRDVRLFEVGAVFRKTDPETAPAPSGDPATSEPLMAGLAVTGLSRARHWAEGARTAGLYDLTGALEEAFSRLRIPIRFERLDREPPFREGTAGRILHQGSPIGRAGQIDRETASRLGIKAETWIAEVSLGPVFEAQMEPPVLRPLPRYPSSSRDLALVVRQDVTWSEIEEVVRREGGSLVAEVSVFDRYTGSALPGGHVSLAVSVVYQHPERTLAAEEVQAAEERILVELQRRFGITLRK